VTERDDAEALLSAIAGARERFLELVAEVRPELHRYCARMTGSVFDGEDVVQDTLARAYFALAEMERPPALRPWLFRIAHNAAMDFLRRYERRNVEVVAEVPESASDERGADPDLVKAALAVFAALPPQQRSALALKDVLGHSPAGGAPTLRRPLCGVTERAPRLRESAIRNRHGKVGQSIAAFAAVVELSNRRFVLPIGYGRRRAHAAPPALWCDREGASFEGIRDPQPAWKGRAVSALSCYGPRFLKTIPPGSLPARDPNQLPDPAFRCPALAAGDFGLRRFRYDSPSTIRS
jgi:RNA polymerase sigma factor (sigma-70 family)